MAVAAAAAVVAVAVAEVVETKLRQKTALHLETKQIRRAGSALLLVLTITF